MSGRHGRHCCRNGNCGGRGDRNNGGGGHHRVSRRDYRNRFRDNREYLGIEDEEERNLWRINEHAFRRVARHHDYHPRVGLPTRYSPFWSPSDCLLSRASTSANSRSAVICPVHFPTAERPVSPTLQQEPKEERQSDSAENGDNMEETENRNRESERSNDGSSSEEEEGQIGGRNDYGDNGVADETDSNQDEEHKDDDSVNDDNEEDSEEEEFIRFEESIRSPSPTPPPEHRGGDNSGNESYENNERNHLTGGYNNGGSSDDTNSVDIDGKDDSDSRSPGCTPPPTPNPLRPVSPSEMEWVATAPLDNIFSGNSFESTSSYSSFRGSKTFTATEGHSTPQSARTPEIFRGYYNMLLDYANNPSHQRENQPWWLSQTIKEMVDKLLNGNITSDAANFFEQMRKAGNKGEAQSSSSLTDPTPCFSFSPGPNMYPQPLNVYCSYSFLARCIHYGYTAPPKAAYSYDANNSRSAHSRQEGRGEAGPEGFGSVSTDISPGTSKKPINVSESPNFSFPSGIGTTLTGSGKLPETLSLTEGGGRGNSVITTTTVNGVEKRIVRNLFDNPPVKSAFAQAPPPLLSPIREAPKSSRKDNEPVDDSLPLSPYSAATEDVRKYKEIGRADAEREIAALAKARQNSSKERLPYHAALDNAIAGPSSFLAILNKAKGEKPDFLQNDNDENAS